MIKLNFNYTIPMVGNKYCKLKPSKYDKDIDMDNNFIISEEDLWNFFEYELNEIN